MPAIDVFNIGAQIESGMSLKHTETSQASCCHPKVSESFDQPSKDNFWRDAKLHQRDAADPSSRKKGHKIAGFPKEASISIALATYAS